MSHHKHHKSKTDHSVHEASLPIDHSERESDYDDAYLNARADATVSETADLPLYTPVEGTVKIATAADLLARCRSYLSRSDVEKIELAYRYADDAHLGQYRKSGEPYITHPLAVATILANWHLDATTVCAGLMHDVLEDTGVAKIEMAERFGVEVTEIVDGVSKLDKLRFSSNEIAQAESFRKMLLAMSRDVRVILVKLADRLHNLRTLGIMRPDKRRRIGQETVEIYVPIAHRLGLNQVYRELQELSFLNMYPRRYEILRENVIMSREFRQSNLQRILRETRSILPKHHIIAQVQGRDKTIYGIYYRMKESHQSFSEALDLYGFRVIVRTKEECYLALGALHQLYKPLHHRFKDFIAIPKSNGYQSLHTTVIGPYGTPVEYQIRTQQMHRIDEMGILSHWMYNDGLDNDQMQGMVTAWIKSLMEIQRTSTDSREFLENIKIDLFPDRVYIFTPKSKIVSLPQGCCPVDFAYQIHTDVGNKCMGCKINGEKMPLNTTLKNGDMVEILTGPDASPDPEWLTFVHSGKARAEVRQYLRNRDFSESVRLGEKALTKAASAQNLDITSIPDSVWESALTPLGVANKEALFADIGLGRQLPAAVATHLINAMHEASDWSAAAGATIDGSEGVSVQYAGCCHPIPGDPIHGFMHKGHGLTIHRTDCENSSKSRRSDPQRWMNLFWSETMDAQALFDVPVTLTVTDERAALAEVATELAAAGSSIIGASINDDTKHADEQLITLMIRVRNRAHLHQIARAILSVPSVERVVRKLDGDREFEFVEDEA